jgi:hypothetical protein
MTLFPIVAIAGSKLPVEALVIPEPDHVPPATDDPTITGLAP